MRTLKTIVIIITASFLSGFTNPDKKNVAGDYNLFRIDRNRNGDVVMYDVKLDTRGNLNTQRPVKVYWKKQSQDGELEPITSIQKKFGYGLRFLNKSNETADFQLVSYKNQVFQIRKSAEGSFRVYTRAAGCQIEVNSLFIQFKDNAFWFPEISEIKILGTDTEKGSLVTATITLDSGNSVLQMAKQ